MDVSVGKVGAGVRKEIRLGVREEDDRWVHLSVRGKKRKGRKEGAAG
jgi:hypothetical protein